ncbi:putative metal ion transporter [gamma proteobacterium HdN1]|nr:putative metal ion transporter [gamma proteobacterium HdN1]
MNDDSRSGSPGRGFLEKIANFLSGEPQDKSELLEMLHSAQENGLIDPEATNIIHGAMQVSEMQVWEIMIPRSQATSIDVNSTVDVYLPLIVESAHSRYPVYEESEDQIIGMLLAKDLLYLASKDQLGKVPLKELLRPAVFVPESKRLNVLLREFKHSHTHMAIVINEYGAMAGLVTIEDILEQIVGEIADEHDFEDDHLIKPSNGREYTVKAMTPIEDFNDYFHTSFDPEDFDTIGGIVSSQFGRLPKRNESIQIGHLLFKVLNADQRTIRLLQVTQLD